MKIVIHGINYSPELTGIGKYSGEMAEWLAYRGHKVRVVSAPPYYPQWQIGEGYSAYLYRKEKVIDFPDPIVYRCPLWVPSKPSGLKRILHLISFAISSLPIMLLQVFRQPDVVLVVEPSLFCSPAALLAARLARGKAILHVQDFELDAAFNMGLIRSQWLRRFVMSVEQWLMRRFDRVSTISGRMMQRLESKGVGEGKRMFFPNWVDTNLIYPMSSPSSFREELRIAKDEVVLLYSGNMGQKQGLELIIESARLLEPDIHVRFVMCGQGAAYESLRRMAEGLQNITWLPLQPLGRLNDLLNLADVHLLPQRADAADLVMPSKLTGMLASGRPVIATAVKGTEIWSVVEGRGINTPPGDVKEFLEAIRLFVQNPEKRIHLGQNGRKYAEEYLSTDTVLERFEKELLLLTGKTE